MRLIPNTVKAHKVITAVVAVILCGAAVAAIVTTNSSSRASYFTAPVSTATIRSTIATSGTVVPRTAVGLNFNVAGVVKTVSVHPGQKVSAGQILASLDTTSLQSAVTGATTSLMEDEARLSLDEAGAPASSLTAAQSSVTSAQIQLSSARQALESTYQGGKENLALSQQALTAAADKITTDKSSLTTDESIAQNWCTNDRPAFIRLIVQSDPHSPDQLRANGVVRNMPEFAHAFSCKKGAPMAPVDRCRVW